MVSLFMKHRLKMKMRLFNEVCKRCLKGKILDDD